ncbi:MAG: hypothetical protein ABII25_03130 [bacterium]
MASVLIPPLKKGDQGGFNPGCPLCKGTGYHGRSAIHEILLVNDEIKKLIVSKAVSAEIREAAIKSGMQTLWENGLEKVAAGVTTMEEVMGVVGEE